ncbi:rust resistance kinase Lr10-like [Mercurialis annua]|uniref:rust resistance kinase Lr10-like n=1 Tax=Mercurialis annua TaxID=3986 RepID=UPI00215EC5A4|nr:rust resistance kinase Lr10-like [Mercurialis annua]
MDFSFFILLMLVLVNHGVVTEECQESRCGRHGPIVRFPFRLQDRQPDHCGFPGFVLSCKKNHLLLELPNSVKLYVDKIDYASQYLFTSDPDKCLSRYLLKSRSSFNLSTTPFQFMDDSLSNFFFFNCTSIDRDMRVQMSCLSSPGYDIYAFEADYPIGFVYLAYCTKIFNISSIPGAIVDETNFLRLNWSKPDCGFCAKQGKYCRLKKNSTSETECFDKPITKPDTKGFKRKLITAGITLGLLLLVLMAFALYRVYKSRIEKEENQAKIELFLEDYKALKPTRYSYTDLKRITNQFKEKLGQGAYGTVFKGKLSAEIFVAVKILNISTGNGEEFINEVKTMTNIHHINVVRLIGYCADGFRRALVYEYLPNESLEKFISSDHGNGKILPLSWGMLQDIAIGIAKGIEYLHQGCDHRILHFDIKPHNILLDKEFNPKISDFGLAKLCSKDQSAISMTTARGTMGYIAPEVYSRNFGNVSYKSDVYSYGMVVLEMVGGRKNNGVEDEKNYFREWIYKQLDKGEEVRIRIEEEGDVEIARKLTIVGLRCIQWNPNDRPPMKSVIQMLEGDLEKLSVPPNPFASRDPTTMGHEK